MVLAGDGNSCTAYLILGFLTLCKTTVKKETVDSKKKQMVGNCKAGEVSQSVCNRILDQYFLIPFQVVFDSSVHLAF